MEHREQPEQPDSRGGSSLVITVRQDGTDGTVELLGELDLGGKERLATTVAQLVANGVTRVRIDAGGLDFVDSSGLTALLNARTVLTALGIEFALDPVSRGVRRVIDLGGVDDLLPGG